ncbi:unnamed protein product [Camellia sinensis]
MEHMARVAVTMTRMLLLRVVSPTTQYKPSGQCMMMNNVAKADKHEDLNKIGDSKRYNGLTNWVPHHRTRIYYPEGHEGGIDGVPDGAVSFDQSHWLRNIDGVDKPDLDTSPNKSMNEEIEKV